MLCRALIGARQDGQQERGSTRVNGAGWPGAVAVVCGGDAHCACHCRSSMIGSRYTTTFRKLPTTRPTADAVAMNATGDCASSSSTALADDGTELEDRQVHRDHQAADQHAEDRHD